MSHHIDGVAYERLVEKDGRPLDEKSSTSEHKREEKFRGKLAEGEAKHNDADERVAFDEELLARYDIERVDVGCSGTRLPRTPLRARSPGSSRSNGGMDRVLNKADGHLWIDTQTFEIARVRFDLTRKVRLWWGMIGSVSKMTGTFERQRCRMESGCPSFDFYLKGRMLFRIAPRATESRLERLRPRRETVASTAPNGMTRSRQRMIEPGQPAPPFDVQTTWATRFSSPTLTARTSCFGSIPRPTPPGERARVAGSATDSSNTTTRTSRFSASASTRPMTIEPSRRSSSSTSPSSATRRARSGWRMAPATTPAREAREAHQLLDRHRRQRSKRPTRTSMPPVTPTSSWPTSKRSVFRRTVGATPHSRVRPGLLVYACNYATSLHLEHTDPTRYHPCNSSGKPTEQSIPLRSYAGGRMLVQTFSALALSVVAHGSEPVEESVGDSPTRTIVPTQSELAQYQITPELDYFGEIATHRRCDFSGVGMFAASAADLITTEQGLSQGLTEGNPAASQRGLRIATHVAGPMAVYYATEKLQRAGKPKSALLLRVSLMVAYSYAAIHNARLINSTP